MVLPVAAMMWATGTRPPRVNKFVRGPCHLWGPRAHRAPRGFTLVEVCISVAILALVCGIMVPSLSGSSRAELRRAAHKIAATIRQTFNDAALNGRTTRMVFNLGESVEGPPIIIESTDDILRFEGDTGALEVAADPNQPDDVLTGPFGEPINTEDPARDAAATETSQTVGALMGISKLGAKAARPTFTAQGNVTLPRGIRVSDVRLEGMMQPVVKGVVRLVFFANGYTQAATLHLEDGDKNMFTIMVEALTGRAVVTEGFVEAQP